MDRLFDDTKSFSFFDANSIDFKTNSEELNTKLFSNIKLVDNTYRDYNEYLRGCGLLENGITNPIDSGDLMLSVIIYNFVNNILLRMRFTS
ncbi:hypothetical protein [Winogradskyella sp.]|uniref:hypothetical protein n=1 Tax=Winogradskyella sp. TaxID=1883156 RepID=UPI0026334B60|nr:hypothetical protein [Winogradskyella sp.]